MYRKDSTAISELIQAYGQAIYHPGHDLSEIMNFNRSSSETDARNYASS